MEFFLGTLSLLLTEEAPVALTPQETADSASMATESPTVSRYDKAATWLQNTLPRLSLENPQEDVLIDGIPCSLIRELPDETQTVQILVLGFPLVAP